MRARRVLAAAMLTCSVTGFAGCGGDDDDDTASGASGDVKKYCELSEKLSTRFDDLGDFGEETTEEEVAAAMKKIVDDNKDLIGDLEDVVPDEIRSDFDKTMNAIRSAAKGDVQALQNLPDTTTMDAFDEKNCK